jgi:hypothetical protein
MMRAMRAAVMVLVVLLAVPARAGDVDWTNPKMGCGKGFAQSGKAVDLPGCTGKLPKDAPAVEVMLREAKLALVEAEGLVQKGRLDKVDGLLASVEEGLARTPPMHPTLPDRWERAKPLFDRAISALRSKRKLLPRLDKLKDLYAEAGELARAMKEDEAGPKRAIKAARACVAEIDEARGDGVDLSVDVDLDKGAQRSLESARAECAGLLAKAETYLKERDAARKVKRERWRKVLRGDRKKIFDAHPDALPEFGGSDPAKASLWRYTTSSGTEVYTFKANKLVNKTTR